MAKIQAQIDTFPNPDNTELRLKVKYWVLLTGLVTTIVTAILVSMYVPSVEVRDVVAVVTGGIVSTTLIYHVLNYHLNYEVNRIKFSFDDRKLSSDRKVQSIAVIGEWHKPDMIRYTITARDFLEKHKGKEGKEFEQELLKDEAARIAVISILNYFERIALAIKEKVFDEEVMREFFKGLFNYYFHNLHHFILLRRTERNNNKIFLGFEEQNRTWNG